MKRLTMILTALVLAAAPGVAQADPTARDSAAKTCKAAKSAKSAKSGKGRKARSRSACAKARRTTAAKRADACRIKRGKGRCVPARAVDEAEALEDELEDSELVELEDEAYEDEIDDELGDLEDEDADDGAGSSDDDLAVR